MKGQTKAEKKSQGMKTCINLSCAFPRSFKGIFINSLRKKEERMKKYPKISSSLPLTLDCLYFFLLFVFQQAQEVTCECSLSEKGE